MAYPQAQPERLVKLFTSGISIEVEMGKASRHFEVWHLGLPKPAVAAVWRNETGAAASSCVKVQQ